MSTGAALCRGKRSCEPGADAVVNLSTQVAGERLRDGYWTRSHGLEWLYRRDRAGVLQRVY